MAESSTVRSGTQASDIPGALETLLRDSYTPIEWEGFTPYDKLPPRPALKQHEEMTLSATQLDKLVGTYRFSPQVVLTIRRERDHLVVQENDETPQELGEARTLDLEDSGTLSCKIEFLQASRELLQSKPLPGAWARDMCISQKRPSASTLAFVPAR